MLWGQSLQFWQTVVFWLWSIAAVTGATAVAASFGSSIVSYYISEATETAAKIEIDRAKADAGRANEAAGQANERAGTANEAAAELQVRAGQLEKDAAEARLEQERLKAQLAWRSIPVASLQRLISTLEMGSGSVTLAYSANDPEAMNFAVQIGAAFNQAQIRNSTRPRWNILFQPRIDTEMIIFGVSIPGPMNATVANLRLSFNAAGIPFGTDDVPPAVFAVGGMITTSGPQTTDALIMVGSKRPPF